MARTKKEKEVIEPSSKDMELELDAAWGVLDKLNPDSAILDENSLSLVDDWIDTGSYALNAIISGSLFRGVPVGRITGLYGLQATGKTLLANKIMANAQKKGYRIVYFDSENALDSITAENLGCDSSKIKHAPIETVEDCKIQAIQLLTNLIEKNLKRKVMIVIDSLGNLNTRKELDDALENKSAGDMGLRAKQMSSLLRNITFRAAKAETPVIFTNHVYENPGEMYPSLIKKQSGGLKPLFIASVLLQLSTITEKVKDETGTPAAASILSGNITGLHLKALTTKNRFVPPFIETTMYLNYKTGLSKYVGLVDMAQAYGILTKDGHSQVYKGEKVGKLAEIENNAEFWEKSGILQELDALIQKDLTFSSTAKEVTV